MSDEKRKVLDAADLVSGFVEVALEAKLGFEPHHMVAALLDLGVRLGLKRGLRDDQIRAIFDHHLREIRRGAN